ncbi:hypothetical protein A2G96_17865 [Cupriavidus nantongensis]|uniref:Uncharacterized protein n=1 Tax=Cupriavidus nantongensis TaxID=1796606 RepID=A0A142JMZ5_9BURK|nr:hypothetical protein A2G96_17865 [Cupriavidus nantongensis]
MPAGLQVFDQNGALVLDIGHRLARITGMFYTGKNTGYYDIPGTNTGDPWFAAVATNRPAEPVGEASFSLSGNRLFWSFPLPDGVPDSTGLYYNNINYMVFTGVR